MKVKVSRKDKKVREKRKNNPLVPENENKGGGIKNFPESSFIIDEGFGNVTILPKMVIFGMNVQI